MRNKLLQGNVSNKKNFYIKDSGFYLKDSNFYIKDNDFCLKESDFYPPSDDRVLESYIEDVDGGDNFADYAEYIFDLYEEEGYYEN